MTRRGWALFAAMAVIWGIPYLLIKIAIGELTPASLVMLRTAIGAALLLPVAAARGWLAPIVPYWRWVLVYTIVEVSLDGSLHKAPCGGEGTGPNPTDRAKLGLS